MSPELTPEQLARATDATHVSNTIRAVWLILAQESGPDAATLGMIHGLGHVVKREVDRGAVPQSYFESSPESGITELTDALRALYRVGDLCASLHSEAS